MRISYWSSDVCSSDLEADGRAAEAQRVADRAGDGLVLGGGEAVGAVDLEDGGNGAGEARRAGLDHAQRRDKGRQPGLEERKRDEAGKSVSVRVDLGGGRIIKKKKKNNEQ